MNTPVPQNSRECDTGHRILILENLSLKGKKNIVLIAAEMLLEETGHLLINSQKAGNFSKRIGSECHPLLIAPLHH